MTKRPSVYDLHRKKGLQKWKQVHVATPQEAAAAAAAGIEIISCDPHQDMEKIRQAAPSVFLSVGMPHGSVACATDAIRFGFETLRRGADCVYCSHSIGFIEAMAREGIPVTGHIGLVPNLATWTNFRAVGKSPEEAMRVLQDARDLENAGAACIEVEVIPVQLADYITRNTRLVTMGMGCGSVCDTQYLFSADVLGTNTGHYPRHAKRYADFAALEAELQDKRVVAFRGFVDDVDSGAYPENKHEIAMDDGNFDRFLNLAQSL